VTEPVDGDTPSNDDRRRLAPPLPAAWRWGFPAFLVVALVWAGVLLVDGLSTVLDSEGGETREAVTDPSAPGFEAFVEQTWSMLVATEDDDGELVQVAVVAATDRVGGGGTIFLAPPEVMAQGCEASPCRLAERHREGGIDHVRETVTRLMDMGMEPFSFSDALLGILSQRLARQLCGKCKVQYDATPDETDEFSRYIGADAVERATTGGVFKLWRADGCVECEKTGYRGRLALHELLVNNDEIRAAIQRKATTGEIRDLAQQAGMQTLLQDGVAKCLQGHTDLKQVLAVCSR